MARIESAIHIQAPPEVVFDFVCDLPRIPEYVPFVREIFDITPGPVRAGTAYKERAKPGPVETLQEWRCTAFERPQRQVYVGRSHDMSVVLTKSFEPAERGTRYAQELDFRFLPQFRPLGWVIERLVIRPKMAKEFDRIVVRIKGLIEAELHRGVVGG